MSSLLCKEELLDKLTLLRSEIKLVSDQLLQIEREKTREREIEDAVRQVKRLDENFEYKGNINCMYKVFKEYGISPSINIYSENDDLNDSIELYFEGLDNSPYISYNMKAEDDISLSMLFTLSLYIENMTLNIIDDYGLEELYFLVTDDDNSHEVSIMKLVNKLSLQEEIINRFNRLDLNE